MNTTNIDDYIEHKALKIGPFDVVDATATGSRAHDDLAWIGCRGEGEWVSPKQAMEIAKAIEAVVQAHNARRAR